MQTLKGLLTVVLVLTLTLSAWYVLALFVRGFLGTLARNAGWGA